MTLSNVSPDTDTFNAILKCWLNSKDSKSLVRMQQITNAMKECHVEPDSVTAGLARKKSGRSTLDDAVAFYQNMERDYQVTPDSVSNNIMINCWAKSGRPDALCRVLEMLKEMESRSKAGKSSVMPDGCTYASVIDCVTKRGKSNAGKQAEALIERMRDLHQNHGGDVPTTAVYNSCLNAWATVNKDGVDRVESILREMEEGHLNQKVVPAPNRMTYNTVLKAMRTGRNDHAARAEDLLRHMEEKARQDSSLAPDSYSYTSVITAYARSRHPQKATKALSLLERMIDSYQAGNLAAKPQIHALLQCLPERLCFHCWWK